MYVYKFAYCVHRVYTWMCTYLLINTQSSHVCVYRFSHMDTEVACVCVYIYVYHTEFTCGCVYICVYIYRPHMHLCTY